MDVDYYVEDWAELLYAGSPLFAYTFAPEAVAGMDGECRFRIKDDVVTYEASGGGKWVHKLWNWSTFGEFFCVQTPRHHLTPGKWILSWVGIKERTYYKKIVYRPYPSRHRAIVLAMPQFRTTGWGKPLAPGLERLGFEVPNRKGWNSVVYFNADNDLMINLGYSGEDANLTLPKEHYDILMSLDSPHSVTTRMIGFGHKETYQRAQMSQH
jgi:hypothetical protein